MTSRVPFRQLVSFARGGGWGSDQPLPGHSPVAVIRGTDFAAVRSQNLADVPRRWEKDSKLPQRTLRPGDLVLEVSGGSSARGQSTGRTLFIDEPTLVRFEYPVIPASFCRVVRLNVELVDAKYAFYGLQDMYKSGRAAEYENQSTGISNFQFERFLDAETLRLPKKSEQCAIARVLAALDDKIAVNERVASTSLDLAQAYFQRVQEDATFTSELGTHIDLVYGKALREPDRRPGIVPVFGCTGQVGWHDSALSGDAGAVVGRKGANAGHVSWSPAPCWVIDTAFYVEIKGRLLTPEFAYFLLKHVNLRNLVGDSAVPGLNRIAALAHVVVIPKRDHVQRFTAHVKPLLKAVSSMNDQNRSLTVVRDALLPGLMSGAIRVRDAEKAVEDAT